MWYRCNGLCTPADPGDYLITGNCSGTGDLTSQTGNQYTYSAKSCLSSTGLCSAMSSPYTVTVQPPPTTCNPPPPPPPPPSSGSFTISYGSSIPVVTAFVTGDPNTYAESQTTGLTVIPQNGYSLAVYYTLTSTFPINAKPKVLPNPVYGPPYSTSQFSVVIPNNTPLGQYTLTVLATGQDGQTQEVPIYLYVGAAATGST